MKKTVLIHATTNKEIEQARQLYTDARVIGVSPSCSLYEIVENNGRPLNISLSSLATDLEKSEEELTNVVKSFTGVEIFEEVETLNLDEQSPVQALEAFVEPLEPVTSLENVQEETEEAPVETVETEETTSETKAQIEKLEKMCEDLSVKYDRLVNLFNEFANLIEDI